MTKVIKKSKLSKVIAIILMMAISISCFCVTASAEAFYQHIVADDFISSPGASFSSGSNNRLTVSASVLNYGAGNATDARISLERYNGVAWVYVTHADLKVVANTNNPDLLWRDYVISPNTSYRLRLICTAGTGSGNLVEAHIGIGMWQKLS